MSGVCVDKIGKSSVNYRLALFELKDDERPVLADYSGGHFGADPVLERYGDDAMCVYTITYVYVNPTLENRPVQCLPEKIAKGLFRIKSDE